MTVKRFIFDPFEYMPYESNPFPSLFRRGLNVTLSTDNPLLLVCPPLLHPPNHSILSSLSFASCFFFFFFLIFLFIICV